ncbi:MAG: glycoside hydrolase family 43 protein [Sedimentisphaerales bacterium]|nr:glycoside hydrolase family 43 protein [Sedimentisphaerales bacterium]HNY78185.1 glycoside hydrolase family 43 protein [Sedimentisphaerales bacterium]HOC65390.1 glycoside hydrolase family 43 protein [Sedimentisphaerales bacterium]HOH63223.1 glycoside hydrolase family 43 protein [Sedimentisphaerales bacterium]HPY48462.1 glycoside hydrolase family 43 protein [Sedimentisphaerales bacterium]
MASRRPLVKGRMMMRQMVVAVVAAVVLAPMAAGQPYLFSYFKGNGEDGLHLAWSADGLTWTALKGDRSFLTPQVGTRLMRDPCICQGPDGTFHMVWTSGWWDKGIGLAHSKDLIHWSEQTWLEVMAHEGGALNCWAPEIYYDAATQKYLIFWSTTVPGRFPATEESGDGGPNSRKLNHRVYYVTTSDFASYSDAKLFFDGGFNVIDATLVREADRYVLFVKDETKEPVAKKNIRIATASRAEGPYGPASEPFSPDWVEGPTALKIGPYWYVYYDAYTRHRMEGARSRDLVHWSSITEELSFPAGVRHGTAFGVSNEILAALKEN